MLSRISANAVSKTVGKFKMTNLKLVTDRSMHSACLKRNRNSNMSFIFDCNQRLNLLKATSVRYASSGDEYPPSILEQIPDIPPLPTPVVVPPKFHENGELMFESMGLGGYSPVGMLQSALEHIHIGLDLPWWSVVMIGTIIVRTAVFPLVLGSLKSSAKLQDHMPIIQKYQKEVSEARQGGNAYEAALRMYTLQDYMKKHDINIFKSSLPLLVQMPIFISFFLALRGMAKVPVESLQTGGLWWFSDLTVADPYYILPVASAVSMYWIIQNGAEGVQMSQNKALFSVLRFLPLLIFPFTYKFPTVIFCYWLTTNVFSLGQGLLLKTPYCREKLGLPKVPVHTANSQTKSEGFFADIKQAWVNAQVVNQVTQRERVNERAFAEAGTKPPMQTFKTNPLLSKQPHINKSSVLAKKRDS